MSFPAPGSQWEHHNGNLYEVLGIANEFSARPEYPPTVVYRGKNGRLWARPASEWARSMTPLPAAR